MTRGEIFHLTKTFFFFLCWFPMAEKNTPDAERENKWVPLLLAVGVLGDAPLVQVHVCALPSSMHSVQLLLDSIQPRGAGGSLRPLQKSDGERCTRVGSFILSSNLNRLVFITKGFGPCTCLRSVCNTLMR